MPALVKDAPHRGPAQVIALPLTQQLGEAGCGWPPRRAGSPAQPLRQPRQAKWPGGDAGCGAGHRRERQRQGPRPGRSRPAAPLRDAGDGRRLGLPRRCRRRGMRTPPAERSVSLRRRSARQGRYGLWVHQPVPVRFALCPYPPLRPPRRWWRRHPAAGWSAAAPAEAGPGVPGTPGARPAARDGTLKPPRLLRTAGENPSDRVGGNLCSSSSSLRLYAVAGAVSYNANSGCWTPIHVLQ